MKLLSTILMVFAVSAPAHAFLPLPPDVAAKLDRAKKISEPKSENCTIFGGTWDGSCAYEGQPPSDAYTVILEQWGCESIGVSFPRQPPDQKQKYPIGGMTESSRLTQYGTYLRSSDILSWADSDQTILAFRRSEEFVSKSNSFHFDYSITMRIVDSKLISESVRYGKRYTCTYTKKQ